MNSAYYNDVPETRGTARNKGTYAAPTARDLEDAVRLDAFRAGQCPHDKPALGHCAFTSCPNYQGNCDTHRKDD